MSTRDTAPYMEQSTKLPDGTWLHAMHNLTDANVDLIRGLLQQHRSNLGTVLELMHSTDPGSNLANGLQQEADELDTLLLHLYPRQPQHA